MACASWLTNLGFAGSIAAPQVWTKIADNAQTYTKIADNTQTWTKSTDNAQTWTKN